MAHIQSLSYKEVFIIYLQQKLCQLFIQLKTAMMETYLKSEKKYYVLN